MNKRYDNLWIGLIAGLVAPVISYILYVKIHDPLLAIPDAVNRVYENNTLTHVISLSAMSNLVFFFLFIKLNMDRAARGVLGATILYGFIILYLKMK